MLFLSNADVKQESVGNKVVKVIIILMSTKTYCVCSINDRHLLLKYGTGNPRNRNRTAAKPKDPKARIEELKRMYRNAAIKNNEG